MTTATETCPQSRIDWPAILTRAAAIVRGYDTGATLRQLFYRLVAAMLLPNSTSAYKSLSRTSAVARRDGWFPDLVDRTRTIHRYQTFADANDAHTWLTDIYRHNRTEEQPYNLYLGVENNGIVAQLEDWSGDLGVPVLALGATAHNPTLTRSPLTLRQTAARRAPSCVGSAVPLLWE